MGETTSARVDRMRRWSATAGSWFRKASAAIAASGESGNSGERFFASDEAAKLLVSVLGDASGLVPFVDVDEEYALYGIEDVERELEGLRNKLRNHRLAAKLAAVEGRTPEEAAAFQAKAAELTNR